FFNVSVLFLGDDLVSAAMISCFFFQAEDGIRDFHVTGVQTCALPIYVRCLGIFSSRSELNLEHKSGNNDLSIDENRVRRALIREIGRASCRERVKISGVNGS